MIDSLESAKEAGLRYVSDNEPGIRRKRRGKGFSYHDEEKGQVKSKDILKRILSLVIPPAWNDVWICRHKNGHLQVTGKDARKRKQYRYHEKWNELRNMTKFDRMLAFSKKLPSLKRTIEADLKLPGLPQNKVVAAVIKTMLITQSRVGNSTYKIENDTYGLTTIHNEHAEIKGSKIHLMFNGKSGVEHDITFSDPQISKIIKRCQELPGEELFCYLNENGDEVDINSHHVNDYLKNVTDEDFTAKDIRTWGGTCKAIEILVKEKPADLSERQWKSRHVSVVKETAAFLRNTVSVCRKYYIHPQILECDRSGKLHSLWKSCRKCQHYEREEHLLMKLLSL
jgi:DNA topoisomerase-1